ncbi:hypothetical protein [Roseomonas sp. AR75]|uniref:hypothetical protein n=1 Tax=Roseomonas sp. AR75 TaxID=2562311 RepID=UPI0010C12FBD|nr:hypothetical protein [Roseomonas sp. AR75]
MAVRSFLAAPAVAAFLGAALVAAPPAVAQDRWQGTPSQGEYQRGEYHRGNGGMMDSSMDQRRHHDVMRRDAQEAFDRGYRAGRAEERRRSMQGSQHSGASQRDRDSAGGGRGGDWWLVVPDILPDEPRYRGMQDFALMPDYTPSMDWLLVAAQSLRRAMQAMAQQPPGQGRNEAMDRAREALLETQQAMVELPPRLRQR